MKKSYKLYKILFFNINAGPRNIKKDIKFRKYYYTFYLLLFPLTETKIFDCSARVKICMTTVLCVGCGLTLPTPRP